MIGWIIHSFIHACCTGPTHNARGVWLVQLFRPPFLEVFSVASMVRFFFDAADVHVPRTQSSSTVNARFTLGGLTSMRLG
jgi:hypothetical protein